MISPRTLLAVLTSLFALLAIVHAQTGPPKPDLVTYKIVGTTELKAHVFLPPDPPKGKLRPAIILLHGGGWNTGSPDWVYDDARRYVGLGMVAIAGEYRLSDQKTTTPLDAMEDTRDLIRWVRHNANALAIDPTRVAVYGVSAGGHLAVAAAVFPHEEENDTSAVPDALLLLSPAVSFANDKWPQTLLGEAGQAKDISPAENIASKLPPILLIQGAADTVTPLAAAQRFCDRVKQMGGACDLHVYPGLGHILTRNLDPHAQEQGPFDADPAAIAKSHTEEDAFLAQLGYTK